MNPYLEPQGFLGTGASLLADLSLLAYLLLIVPAMIGGYVLARRGLHRPHHKWLMIGVTVLNWVLIFALMLVAYNFDVIHNIGEQPTNARYLLPTLHGALGLPAQLLATFIVVRMLIEDTQVARAKQRGERNLSRYWFKGARWTMRLTLVLWLGTSGLGFLSYLVRYDVLNTSPATSFPVGPAITEEAGAPEATAEALGFAATPGADRPVATAEAASPAQTPEVESPLATAEVTEPAFTSEPVAPVVTPEVTEPATTPEPGVITLFELFGPIATAEVSSPAETPEVVPPVATAEVFGPVTTPEVIPPVATEEADSGRGRGRGRGRGGDEPSEND